jgi:hypothetical protein
MDVHSGRDRAATSAKKKPFFTSGRKHNNAGRAVKPYRGRKDFISPRVPLYHALSSHHRRRRTAKAINFLTAPVLEQTYANNIINNPFLVLICPRLLRLKVIVTIIIGETHAHCLRLRITCRLIHHDSRQLACCSCHSF